MALANKIATHYNTKYLRELALKSVKHGVASVQPHTLVKQVACVNNGQLKIGTWEASLTSLDSVVVVGAGKANGGMAQAVLETLGQIDTRLLGSVNIPHGQDFPQKLTSAKGFIELHPSAHPTPDEHGLLGAKKIAYLASGKTLFSSEIGSSDLNVPFVPQKSLLLVLISGGGSALMPLPQGNITLSDLQVTNNLLLSCGATIQEINTVRKVLDMLKGGKLARIAAKAGYQHIVSLILSDVVGDPLEFIASGPTVQDETTFANAVAVCSQYKIMDLLPPSVKHFLTQKNEENIETQEIKNLALKRTTNMLIGSAKTSAKAVQQYLLNNNFEYVHIFSHTLQGEASEVGKNLLPTIQSLLSQNEAHNATRVAFIATGEFTVTLRKNDAGEIIGGIGGRNQEMLLSCLAWEQENKEYNLVIFAGAFDGVEGNSPAMGAVIDNVTFQNEANVDFKKYLLQNDSYTAMSLLNSTVVVGQTGTNVNDMLLILAEKRQV